MNHRQARGRMSSLFSSIAAIGLLIAAFLSAGGAAASARDLEPACIYYAGPNGHPIELYASDPRCPVQAAVVAAGEEAQGWPDYDPTRAIDEGRIELAIAEAQGWPDFDPTRAIDEGRIELAIAEAQGWPDYDPTRAIDEGKIELAIAEAQEWPNYDPTRIQVDDVITIADAPRGATVLQ